MEKKYPSWLTKINLSEVHSLLVHDHTAWINVSKLLKSTFILNSLYNKKLIVPHSINFNITIDGLKKLEELIKGLGMTELGAAARYLNPNQDKASHPGCGKILVDEDTILFLDTDTFRINKDYEYCDFNLYVLSNTEELVSKLYDIIFRHLYAVDPDTEVYTLVSDSQGNLAFSSIGQIRSPLERNNYISDVIESYDYVKQELVAEDPAGRLFIFDGPPGTGKTHMIRGLINEVEDVVFVIIPPDTVESLTGPRLIPLLMEAKSQSGIAYEKPIVFILEDADNAIVPRARDNMSIISTLLNLTDGIIGSLFDIKIVATTNAKIVEIEPALLRSGRLSSRVSIDLLDPETATKVLARLTKDNTVSIKKPTSLADIYAMANERRIPKSFTTEKRKLGF